MATRIMIILKSKFNEIVIRECNTDEYFKSVGDTTIYDIINKEPMEILEFRKIDISKHVN